jgi:DNA-binding IscR family transcriptional regulator
VWSSVGEKMRTLLSQITLADLVDMARGESPWPEEDN